MPRSPRQAPGGYVYHALNGAVARTRLFKKDRDYEAFLRVLDEAHARHPIRILGYCVMPTHWHFVLWPKGDGELTDFLRWLTHTHTMRRHRHFGTVGSGHLYQGRFKAFPVQEDEHFYTLLRYVERNALRAGLVRKAENWPWSSLAHRLSGQEPKDRLSAWPVKMPRDWLGHVNQPQTEAELEALRRSVIRGTPFGDEGWQKKTARALGLEFTMRERGRPKKVEK
jgi:REP-associated tyrosine transposase